MLLIELHSDHLDMLMKCKNTNKRPFSSCKIEMLLNEAILEFYMKYGKQ